MADVWAFVADPRNEPTWHADILHIEPAPESPAQPDDAWSLGSTWLVTVRFLGRRRYLVQVTALEPNRRIEITTRTGPMRPVATCRLEATDGGTRFTRRIDLPVRGLLRIAGPLLLGKLRERNAIFVRNLKTLLERDAPSRA